MSAIPRGDAAHVDPVHALTWRTSCLCCGGPIEVDEGTSTLECTYCGHRGIVDRTRPVALFQVHRLDVDEAALGIKRWLREQQYRATSVDAVARVSVPFWGLRRELMEWAEIRDADSSRARDRVAEAWLPGVTDAADWFERVPDVNSVDADHRCYPVAAAHIGSDVLVAGCTRDRETTDELRRLASQPVDLELPMESALMGERWYLLYRPFYFMGYEFKDQRYTVVASGDTGEVVGRIEGDLMARLGCAPASKVVGGSGALPQVARQCPTCSGPVHGRAGSTIVRCGPCRQAWAMTASGLTQVHGYVAGGEGRALPFWRIRFRPLGESEAPLPAIYVPAFEACPPPLRRRLMTTLSVEAPEYEESAGIPPDAEPCSLSREAAIRIAATAGPDVTTFPRAMPDVSPASLPLHGADVVWLPFRPNRGYLTEAHTGASISDAVFTVSGDG